MTAAKRSSRKARLSGLSRSADAGGSGGGAETEGMLGKAGAETGTPEAAALLAAIVDASDDAMISTDLDGIIRTWNWAAEQMYGYSAHEAVGQSISFIVPAGREGEARDWLMSVRRDESVRYRATRRVGRSGNAIDVTVSVSPVRSRSGEVVGAMLVHRDATEQRWMAAALDETMSKLETALSEARTSEVRSRRFLADAAHQLRTPITGIMAAAENLLEGVDPVERDRLVGNLVRETSRAGRLVKALLRVARLDEGEPLSVEPCELVDLCAEEVDRSWTLAPHLDFVVCADRSAVGRPTADADAVREIIANLLDNARRFAVSRISVDLERTAGAVEIRVADDGPGIPSGMEECVFERFVVAGDSGGSGLGLAIARELADRHGGELRYDCSQSSPRFVLSLPASELRPSPDGL